MTPLTPAQATLAAEHFDVATWAARQASWRWPGADRDDLLSWACEGLMRAAAEWDPDRGMTFVGYARSVVRRNIVDCWRERYGRYGHKRSREFPFDHTLVDGPRDDPPPADIVAACASVDLGFERIEETVHAAATIDTLQLTERERYVLVELGSGTSLQEIGAALGVSESRVCQIRKAIYDRLPVNGGRPRARDRCERCGGRFTVDPHGTKRRFCSNACAKAAWRLVNGRERARTA